MKLISQVTSGVRWTSLSSILTTAAEIARSIVLARFLSPVDFGLMAMAGVVIGFAQTYLDLGISAAIIHRQDATREQLSSLYWLNIVTGFIAFSVIRLCTPLITSAFREPRLQPLLQVVAMIFIITPLGAQFEILLQKELMFKVLAKQEIFASLCSLVVGVVCAVTGLGVWALVYAFLANIILKTLLLVLVGLANFRPSLHFRRSDLKGYMSFGLFQMGERTVNYLSERLDQILIGPFLGAQALGFYNFAFSLTGRPIWRINPILTRVAFPVFSKVQHDSEKLRRGYIKLLGFLATINAPLLIGLAAVARWGVPFVFGVKWSGSVILIQILSLVSLSRSIGNPIGSLQLAKGRADLGFWWNVLLFACSLPTIYLGAKMGQATGVALALLLLQICLAVPAYLLLVRPLIGRCGWDYARTVLKPIVVAFVMGFVVISFSSVYLYGDLSRTMQLIAQVLLGALVYIFLLRIIDRKTLMEFRSVLFSR